MIVLLGAAVLAIAWPTASSAIQERWSRARLTAEVKQLKQENRRQVVELSELRTTLADWSQVFVGLDLAARERETLLIKCVRKRERREAACLRRL